MSDLYQFNRHGERITRLETRADNHDNRMNDQNEAFKEMQKDLKWQTKQIFMGMGGLAVIVFILEIIFKK